MTHEKVEKQGRDDHCELSHKTALPYRVVGPNNSIQHIHFYFLRHEQFIARLSLH